MILEIENLFCGYPDKPVLQEISFSIRSGEIVGIIGPNGSGKTTLLRVMTKVLKPEKGKIFWDRSEINRMKFGELARKIAVVSQSPAIDLNLTIEDFVLFGRFPHRRHFQFLEGRRDKEIAERAMELTGVLEIRRSILGNLSGGERKLALIARALCQEPEFLLLDEPTAHLDITHQVQILDLVRRLNRREGMGVILVLHDLNYASEYCDRLVLLHGGRLYRLGPPEEVLTYQIIEEVYRTTVVVRSNPISGRPFIFLVSEEEKRGERSSPGSKQT